MPWAYVRSVLARRWQCFPWQIDDMPIDEVQMELKIMSLEGEAWEFKHKK